MSDTPVYLDALHTFYSERLKAGLKNKFSTCKGCKDKKQFIIKEGKLYYTCGASSGDCGLQLEITLAKYLYYPEVINTHQIVSNMIDKRKHPDLYSEEDIKEYKEFIEGSDAILKQATKDFIKLNKLNDRSMLIQKTHRDRINHKKEQNLLMNKIQEEKKISKKHILMRDYLVINQQINKNYMELQETCNPINNFLLVEKGSTSKESDTFEGITKNKDKKWNLLIKEIDDIEMVNEIIKKLESKELIGSILRHFLTNDTLTEDQYIKIKGTYRSPWLTCVQSLLITNPHSWLITIQHHLNSSIIENPDKKTKVITITKKWRDVLDQINKNKDKKLGKVINKNLIPELQGLVKQPKNDMIMNIIVAYRDPGDGSRKAQLKQFKEQINLIFKDQTDVRIYIIEQEGNRSDYGLLPELLKQPNSEMAKFNLGILKNIGFAIASKSMKDKDAYYILSDVDLLPSINLVKDYLTYPKNPIHLANKGTRYNISGTDHSFLGGVISVNKKDFIKANGYPNNFWGWGGEDNALNRRFKQNSIQITKSSEPVIDLEKLSLQEKLTKLRTEKTKEMRKKEKLKEDMISWKENGLSSLEGTYKITTKLKAKNITLVKVKLQINTEKDISDDGDSYEPEPETYPVEFKSGDQIEWIQDGKLTVGYITEILSVNNTKMAKINAVDGIKFTKPLDSLKRL